MGDYVKFDQQRYIKSIKAAIAGELKQIEPYIMNIIRSKVGAIEFRSVDAKYKAETVNSIVTRMYEKADKFIASIGAGGEEGRPNQAFRAVYYEYGTGNKMQPPTGWYPKSDGWGAWNMARKGRDIYQRPKGTWYDLGGNPHTSKLKGEPKKLPDKGLGREIAPTYWFRDSMNTVMSMVEDAVRRAVKSVPISAYIRIRSINKRM